MKKDSKYWILEISKLVCFLVVPLLVFIYKFTTIGGQVGGAKFIVGCSAYIFAIVVYILFKVVILKQYLGDIHAKKVNYETQLETETEQEKIALIEKALRRTMIVDTLFKFIPVMIGLSLLLLVVKALETDLVTFYSALELVFVGYVIGFIIMFVQNLTIKSKNRR